MQGPLKSFMIPVCPDSICGFSSLSGRAITRLLLKCGLGFLESGEALNTPGSWGWGWVFLQAQQTDHRALGSHILCSLSSVVLSFEAAVHLTARFQFAVP